MGVHAERIARVESSGNRGSALTRCSGPVYRGENSPTSQADAVGWRVLAVADACSLPRACRGIDFHWRRQLGSLVSKWNA